MDEQLSEEEGIRCETSVPLTSTQETIVTIAHYAVFVTCYLGFYCTYSKQAILNQRIYSTFLLFSSLISLIICPGFEIGEHYFTDPNPWEIAVAPSNLINGSFQFFNGTGICLMALAVRKIGTPFFRKPDFSDVLAGLIDLVLMVADIFIAIFIVAQPILYFTLGRLEAQTFTNPINGASGILILIRLWQNLGPNRNTLIGGVGYLVMTLLGVFNLVRYEAECVEFIHFYIGGSFGASLIFFCIAVLNAEPPDNNNDGEGVTNETTPLNRV